MDEIEITVFDEIKDYKEKIYFFNFRQWFFAILIVLIVVPTYILLKDKIGEEVTSYIVIAIAGVLGFIGFVKIHELPAEKIIPYWFRHYFIFAKSIHYISDKEYEEMHQKKRKSDSKVRKEKKHSDISKTEIKELKKKQKQEKLLEKAKKKYGITENEFNKDMKNLDNNDKKNFKQNKEQNENVELLKKLSNLSVEQKEALLKLLDKS